jgi:hypothetical protein
MKNQMPHIYAGLTTHGVRLNFHLWKIKSNGLSFSLYNFESKICCATTTTADTSFLKDSGLVSKARGHCMHVFLVYKYFHSHAKDSTKNAQRKCLKRFLQNTFFTFFVLDLCWHCNDAAAAFASNSVSASWLPSLGVCICFWLEFLQVIQFLPAEADLLTWSLLFPEYIIQQSYLNNYFH